LASSAVTGILPWCSRCGSHGEPRHHLPGGRGFDVDRSAQRPGGL